MEKFQISVIDFMFESGKHEINEQDSEGNQLYVGDIVEYRSEKHMIVYRYGQFNLKQPHTIHTIHIEDWSQATKLNEMWSTSDYAICGEVNEPFYGEIKHLL